MKSLSKMPQILVLFFSSKVEREAAKFPWQRERPALSYYPPSPFSLTCPPSHCSLSACGSRAPPCWVPPLLLSRHRRHHPAHCGCGERAHGGGGCAAGRGRQREPRQAPPLSLGPLSLCWKPPPRCPPQWPAPAVSSLSLPPCPSPPPRSDFGTFAPFLGRVGANGSLTPQQPFPPSPPRIPSSRALFFLGVDF